MKKVKLYDEEFEIEDNAKLIGIITENKATLDFVISTTESNSEAPHGSAKTNLSKKNKF